MHLDLGAGAREFDGVLGPSNGVDDATQNIVSGVTVNLAAGLVERQELGLRKVCIQCIDSAFGRQSQPGRHLRRFGLLFRAGGFHFFIKRDCFGSVPTGGAVFFVLVGRIPVD